MTSDPLRTDTTEPLDALEGASGTQRDAKIEQLLLTGLDHYFAAQYDQAINIWTRALFFDRNHPRARAYIERARRAQAERQRESEELLHSGAVAYRRGDGREARRLLQAALDAGAPFEDTFPMLERLNQLDVVSTPAAASRTHQLSPNPRTAAAPKRNRLVAVIGGALVLLALAAVYAVSPSRVEWLSRPPLARPRTTLPPPVAREASLGVPTNGELALSAARQLFSKRDLRGAMTALERVRPTDAQREEADRLLSEIQRQLIAEGSRQ